VSFSHPLALGLGALLGPLVVAYLVQSRLRRRPVPSLLILRVVAGVEASRRHLRRPTHLLSLLLAALALGAMALDAAGPRAAAAGPTTLVVLLDTSSSMAARDDRGLRFERALDELGRLVRALGPEDRVALVAAGPEARLVVGLTRDRERALREAHALVPAGSNAGLGEALRVGAGFCREPGAHLVFITDGAAPPPPVNGACALEVDAVGAPAANAGITTFAARAVDGPNLTEVLLGVEASGGGARKGLVTLTVDGAPVDAVPFALEPGRAADRLLRLSLPPGEVLAARLTVDGADALAHDDLAAAPLPRAGRTRTLLVTARPQGYLASALALAPRADLTVVAPSAALPAGPFDLAVLEALPRGALPEASHVAALGVDPRRFGVRPRALLKSPEVIRWAFGHPLMRFVELDKLNLASARLLEAPPGAEPLLEAPEGPLAVLITDGPRRTAVVGFAVDDSDLPLRVAFANLVANLVDWAAPWEPAGRTLALGETPSLQEDTRLVPLGGGGGALGPGGVPLQPGAFRLERGGRVEGIAVANLTAPGETDLRPRLPRDLAGPPALRGDGGMRLGLVLAALALLLLVLEQALPALRRARARRQQAAGAQPAGVFGARA
jgi:hypothetical protein